jgi:dUTP pyrophosphatase
MAAKNMNIKVAWKALSENAKKPQKAHNSDAGFDLYSAEEVVIKPHQTVLVKTDIAIQMTPPAGWNAYALVKDTSGNAYKLKLSTKAGVVDIEYTGNVGVVIRNNNFFKRIKISKGSKIAQLIPTLIPFTEETEWVEKETERGDKGYGASTGVATDK